jgi:dihydropteroate synthase
MSVQLVGILNVTPDSFSDGGAYLEPSQALQHAADLFRQGANIIDIGGEATNPWAKPISIEEEWQRLSPILAVLIPAYPNKISIDTRHPEIVDRAAAYGMFFVNDVTTFIDPKMIKVVAKHHLRVIVSHIPLEANGDIMLAHTKFKLDDMEQVKAELLAQKTKLLEAGVAHKNIILDPGIGFGKSMRLNWQLLNFAEHVPEDTVMIGHSRKRFLATDPETGNELPGAEKLDIERNLNAAKQAILSGALYLRVHDVAMHKKLIDQHVA